MSPWIEYRKSGRNAFSYLPNGSRRPEHALCGHRQMPPAFIWACALLFLTSCSGGSGQDKWTKSRPETSPVSGTVTYDGKPLAEATVVFSPVGEQQAAVGRTDARGNFRLTTFKDGDGAIPGNYKVGITCVHTEGPLPGTNLDEVIPTIKETSIIPVKYGNFEKSGLTTEVLAKKPNSFDFALSSK